MRYAGPLPSWISQPSLEITHKQVNTKISFFHSDNRYGRITDAIEIGKSVVAAEFYMKVSGGAFGWKVGPEGLTQIVFFLSWKFIWRCLWE